MLLKTWLWACAAGDSHPAAVDAGDLDGDGWREEDCDDQDAAVHPDAPDEWYDGLDSDCDGADDWDQDQDGARAEPWGADCDDLDPTVGPAVAELCDGLDQDCDGEADEDAVDATTRWTDADGDGWGADAIVSCAEGVTESGDCDDADPEVHPGADETCDGADEDCDDLADDHPVDGLAVYLDADGDGWGAEADSACDLPAGWSATGGDCDDADPDVHPGATQACGLEDADCDGLSDEDQPDRVTVWPDADGDGWGDEASPSLACEGLTVGGDCDDADPAVNPAATEDCDGVDDDCSGVVDDAADAPVYYPDADGDGWGGDAGATPSCDAIEGWLDAGGDCDDGDAAVNPDAAEVCDGLDDDCDGTVDVDATDAVARWVDLDGDGYGEAELDAGCTAGAGEALAGGDCDDADATVNPGNRERCDGADDDCDGEVDEDAADAPTRWLDADGDGWGDAADSLESCDPVEGRAEVAGDCDDADAAIHPGAADGEGLVDDDCDGLVDEDLLAVGDLVITEIARQPYAGGDGLSLYANSQWFELHNASDRELDLLGFAFDEQDGDHFEITSSLLLAAGESAALCYGDPWFDSADCAYAWGDAAQGEGGHDASFYFDRDEDLLRVSAGDLALDEVWWLSTWPAEARKAMMLDEGSTDPSANDDAAAWCLATTSYTDAAAPNGPDYGSPGAANGSCP